MSENQVPVLSTFEKLILSFTRVKDTKRKKLSPTAMTLALWLVRRGYQGTYPGTRISSYLCGVSRPALFKAEKMLVEVGLVEFSKDANGWRTYRIMDPLEPLPSQKDAWQRFITPGEAVLEESQAKEAELEVVKKPAAEQIAWFLESAQRMHLYLRFGAQAYNRTFEQCADLPSSNLDWLVHKPADLLYPFDAKWTNKQYQGYFWDGVCKWREAHGLPLNFPAWGRLAGEIKNLVKANTPLQAYTILWSIVNLFDLIAFRVGGRIGDALVLDETSISNQFVRQQAMVFATASQEFLDAEMARMAEAKRKG